tara:strand:- start:1024 stop:1197 length:174 start_codon:yes stop_codon:yes gene_type:complete
MTDMNKYRNVSLTHDSYNQLIKLSNTLVPHLKLSISKTIESLANEKSAEVKKRGKKI